MLSILSLGLIFVSDKSCPPSALYRRTPAHAIIAPLSPAYLNGTTSNLAPCSSLIYFIENEAQPEAFPNIFASFWWAIATLTTVGYGDVYPITGWGKFLSGIIAFLGIGVVALPTGIISSGFMQKLERRKKQINKCPHCGKSI